MFVCILCIVVDYLVPFGVINDDDNNATNQQIPDRQSKPSKAETKRQLRSAY